MSGASYLINEVVCRSVVATAIFDKMNFEHPLTFLVWLTSISVGRAGRGVIPTLMIPDLGDGSLWWKLSTVITCGTLAGAIIPIFAKVFTSHGIDPRQGSRELIA